jgi:tRNA dimethylallyltransferase
MLKKSYIVAGPTASGKSGFAHNLAKRIGGTIINADSVQIYKGIENISASPFASVGPLDSNDEIDGVPYKLFSICDLKDQLNVAEYLEMARREFDAAEIPVFVGGSGYYIDAIINGISPIPEISAENRNRAREIVAESPDAARQLTDFEFTDPQRMARALEVFLETGRPITEWQLLPRKGAITPTPYRMLVMPHRDILVPRIKDRLKVMLDEGGMDEVKAYMDFPDRAIGIDEVGKYLKGEISLDAAIDNWALRTNQYAKRQGTWFRNKYNPDQIIMHIPDEKDVDLVIGKSDEFWSK